MADMRYSFIENICEQSVVKCQVSKEYERSVQIDSVLTNRYLALPVFAGIMVFISLDELLPSAEKYGKHHISISGVVAGMAIMGVSLLLL